MRMTIYHVVQAELTNLTVIWTAIVKTAVDLPIVDTTLSILTLAVDEVIVCISAAALLQVKQPDVGI